MTERGRRIAEAAGLVMAAYLASRALGLVREMVIARQFGTSAKLGAYLAAFRVPDFIFQLLAGGALGSSLIPVLSSYLAAGEREKAWRLASAIYNLVGLLATASAALAFLFAPALMPLLVPGFSPELQKLTGHLMRIMLLTPVVFGLSGISMAVLHALQHFLLPALAPLVYNLSIILGALLLGPQMDVYGLAASVAIGSCLHLLIQMPGLRKQGWAYTPTLGLRLPGVREVARLFLPRVLGLAVMQLYFITNVVLSSRLAEGSLPALNYAFLLMMLPQGIFAMAIATAAFPTFSDLVARQQTDTLRETLSATLKALLFLAIPAAVGLYILREPLVRVLLERGEFTGSSTAAVAWALQFYALGLPAYAVVEIVSRAFYALHDTRTPVAIGAATVALNIVLSVLLIGPLTHGGLALANALAVNVEMIGLLWVIRRRLARLKGGLLAAAGRSTLAAGIMALGLLAFLGWAPDGPAWGLALGGICLAGILYLGAAWVLGAAEPRALVIWVWQWLRGWISHASD